MNGKQRRTKIIGALIFVALVAIAGFGLVATGNFHNPLNFFGGDQHQGGPVSQTTNNNSGRGQGFTPDHPGFGGGRGQGFTPDRPDFGGGPDAENNNGIAWNQIGGVFFDLWVLSAIVASYILAQQMLGLVLDRFWARKDPPASLAS
jgi:hypothetical protein